MVGGKKPGWEVTTVRRVTATSARVGDGQFLLPYPPPSGSHRRRGRALNYLGKKGRERATNPGGRCEKVIDHKTCGTDEAGGVGTPGPLRF